MDDRHDSLARGGSNQSGPLDDQIKEGISPLHTRSFSKSSASLISGPGPRSTAIDLVRKISFFLSFRTFPSSEIIPTLPSLYSDRSDVRVGEASFEFSSLFLASLGQSVHP